ncbi:hypothetical protein [Haloarcula marismortui]|uniref:Uncharacterized protein n=1 Tax=Haloarcula marismortui ATCC 33800 TaxID=662476 RepID=A0A8T8KLQ5_9EURY|nr:hypothetical protein [Haloarcula sinaiiensis]QUJ74005.1 hypothetical protein KDQ40_18730 [Haloarcula sinaiiensis ATCC 33800]
MKSTKGKPAGTAREDSATSETTPDWIDVLHTITQETRYDLLQIIIGHPKGSPSLSELTYMADVTNESTVYQHLQRLMEIGVVEKITVENQEKGYPRKFYHVPKEVLESLQDRGLFEDVVALRKIYDSVRKNEEIREAEEAPRPVEGYDGDIDPDEVMDVLREFANQHEDPEEAVETLRDLQEGTDNNDQEGIRDRILSALEKKRGEQRTLTRPNGR